MQLRRSITSSFRAVLCLGVCLAAACASSKVAGPGTRGPGSSQGFDASYDDSDDPLIRPPARDDGTTSNAEPAPTRSSDDIELPSSAGDSDSEPSVHEEDLGDDDFGDFDPDDLGGDDDDE